MTEYLPEKRIAFGFAIRSPQNFVAGVALLVISFVGWLVSADLSVGSLGSMGPGMLPRAMLVCLGLCGIALVLTGMLQNGSRVSLPDFSATLLIVAIGLIAIPIGSMFSATGGVFGLTPTAVVFCVLFLAVMIALVVLALRRSTWLDRSGLRGPVFVIGGIIAFAMTVQSVGLLIAGPLLAAVSGAASPDTRFKELIVFAIAITALCIGLFKYVLRLPMPVLIIPGILYL